MTPQAAVRAVLDQAADQAGARGGSAHLAARFAGGTRALATDLGVSQRTVQRWLKYEQGAGGQSRSVMRSPQAGPVTAMADAERQQEAIRAIREHGMAIERAKIEVEYAGEDEGDRELEDIELDLSEMLDELEAGDEEAAANALQSAVLESYGAPLALTITDIEADFVLQ